MKKVGQHLDPGEVLELVEMPWTELVSKSLNGEIRDVKTIVAAMWLAHEMAD
ncbi:hypothetical protein [uncultured Parasutterella sp.]|uniref:hypothetical protein n=1 Tax=uncultured Parasutterella sp. TaxID=1263098 RepID=UPI0025B4A4D0|nr:hypothetical protein [uncultured Parasutterella sp.]